MHQADVKLVQQLLGGDEAAFTVFYNTYFARMYRFCRSRVSNDDYCSDIVQQSMTSAMRYLHTYRGEASLLTWLFQITRNEIATWFKQYGKNDQHTQALDANAELLAALESLPVGLDGSAEDGDDEVKFWVQTALDALPSSYGLVLELKYIEGLSVQDIALQMGTGETAVQSLLARARKAFKEAFVDVQRGWVHG